MINNNIAQELGTNILVTTFSNNKFKAIDETIHRNLLHKSCFIQTKKEEQL